MSKRLIPSQHYMDRVSALTARISERKDPPRLFRAAKAMKRAGLGAKATARALCMAEGGLSAAERCGAELPDVRVSRSKGDDAEATEFRTRIKAPTPRQAPAAAAPTPASPKKVIRQFTERAQRLKAQKAAPPKVPCNEKEGTCSCAVGAPPPLPPPPPAPPRRVAARKATGRPSCPKERPECGFGLLGATCGLPAVLFLPGPSGPERQPARYCLAEVSRLIPSHNPLAGFRPRPEYPADTQERVYDMDVGEQLKVRRIGQQLQPEIVFQPATDGINGPPIVTEDGIVLGGNGRAQGLQVHYAEGGTAARAYLLEHAGVYGFTRADVERLAAPVVVRVVRVGNDARTLAALVRKLNISLTQGLDVRAEAVGEARRLSDEVLQVLGRELGDETTLAQFLSSARSKDLIAALRRSEVITDSNASRYLVKDSGLLSDQGRQLVERLLAARLLPDARLLDDLGAETRGVLARGAPYLLAAAGWGPEWDLAPPLRAAARDLVRLRAQEARSVGEYLKQQPLIATERPAIVGVPLGRELLELLFQLGGKPLVFSRFAQAFARLAGQNPSGQEALFAAEKVSPSEALRRAAREAGVDLT